MMARRSKARVKRLMWDPIHVTVRRYFIKKFLTADAMRLNGVRYNPGGMIEADRDMVEYFNWLAKVANGRADDSSLEKEYCHSAANNGCFQ
jgi:hypothetical protein